MLEEDVNGFPEGVVEDLDDLLVLERMRREFDAKRNRRRRREGRRSWRRHGGRRPGRAAISGSPFGRSEAHDDIARAHQREPGRGRQHGKVQRGQRALTDDHRVDEFHRDVLRVGGVNAAAEGQQATAAKKSGPFPGRPARRRASRSKKDSYCRLRWSRTSCRRDARYRG